jgi:hypothetical protein
LAKAVTRVRVKAVRVKVVVMGKVVVMVKVVVGKVVQTSMSVRCSLAVPLVSQLSLVCVVMARINGRIREKDEEEKVEGKVDGKEGMEEDGETTERIPGRGEKEQPREVENTEGTKQVEKEEAKMEIMTEIVIMIEIMTEITGATPAMIEITGETGEEKMRIRIPIGRTITPTTRVPIVRILQKAPEKGP